MNKEEKLIFHKENGKSFIARSKPVVHFIRQKNIFLISIFDSILLQ